MPPHSAGPASGPASGPDATLAFGTLDRLAPELRPAVDPRELRSRIVHFGLGAFHRAHQAVYTEHAAARSGEPWGIAAVAPRSADTVAALRAQDGLYSVTGLHGDGPVTRVVGSVTEALRMGSDAARIDTLLASPDVTVVTLTISEKGYHRRPGSGVLDAQALDTGAPGIAADLAAPDTAGLATVVGRLAAGLAARQRAGGAPVTVVSCDNMAANGPALAGVLRGFVEASSWPGRRALLDWLETSVAFPSTVVDRIVPATAEADRAAAHRALGVRDGVPVVAEPYRQWVLEDAFAGARPPWERDGALFVPDVVPYQLTKLRLLNGSHSALAHIGAAAGCGSVAEALATEWGERLVRAFCAEVGPTLPAGGPDPAAYADDLVARFRNPGMRHLLQQIGSDGSLKLPERWFGALRALRAASAPTPVLELALAAWVNATRPAPDGGGRQVYGTTDPAAAGLAACRRDGPDTPDTADTVRRLLGAVGAADLAGDPALVSAVTARLPALRAGRVEI
ncbi:mannitol dehydrogenase family protein [Streptomyces paludis]|uniref:Mannitol-1-phosphate 5-dehydrogenase n=2 Tax=Streptomyces paludis TaxID=2282738 RepID=A0A345HYA5_9ACTN|nr:mannitol dehydrogenase family protein [Streptomyces paludis]